MLRKESPDLGWWSPLASATLIRFFYLSWVRDMCVLFNFYHDSEV